MKYVTKQISSWKQFKAWGSEEVTQYPVREVKPPLCFDLVCHQAGCRLSTFCLFTFLWSEEAKSGPGNCTPANGQFWAWYWVGLVRKIFKPGQGTTSWYYISVAELILLLPTLFQLEPAFCKNHHRKSIPTNTWQTWSLLYMAQVLSGELI